MTSLTKLLQDIDMHQPAIIGVDGGLGAGKSTIANALAGAIGCTCLHLDSFLLHGRQSFLPSLEYDELGAVLANAKGTLIVEGICLLAVLDRLSVRVDYLVFVDSETRTKAAKKSGLLQREVGDYLISHTPQSKANAMVSLEDLCMKSSYDVDIAYIKSKTLLAIVLAIGGVIQTIAGALLLNTGLNDQGATLKIMGAEISATGLGGVVLCTSVIWAYFAYLARPRFSSRSETRSTRHADGSTEEYEFRSSTQVSAAPEGDAQQDTSADT